MIRVSIMYPNAPDRKFDMKYYIDKHMAMVQQMLAPLGARAEVDRGIGTVEPGAPAPFVTVCHMYFKNSDEWQQCMSHPRAAEMIADVPNFTNVQPQVQISEIL